VRAKEVNLYVLLPKYCIAGRLLLLTFVLLLTKNQAASFNRVIFHGGAGGQ
jgi:hypothetical protein